jgi:hypothetical protein
VETGCQIQNEDAAPHPALLSFYPAEKKVSKENGGHWRGARVCEPLET